jgi:hypothetical protein
MNLKEKLYTVCRLNSLKFEKKTNARPGIVYSLFFWNSVFTKNNKTTVMLFFVNTIWQLSSAALAAAICIKNTFS